MAEVCIAGFGEVMLRLSPRGTLRFSQALPGELDAVFGGGEANVCVSLAQLGMKSRYLSALPRNPIADALVAQMRGLGVDVSGIMRTDRGRLGIYFAETGANQRGSTVIYDREHSAISLARPDEYDFEKMLAGVTWLHLSGITPAVSEAAYLSTLEIAHAASKAGIKISLDLNFRKKLWRWRSGTAPRDLAGECMSGIAALADVLIGNEEDAYDFFGIKASHTSVESGKLDIRAYGDVASRLAAMFPKVSTVAFTLRESISACHNNWGAMLYEVASGKTHFAPLDDDGQYRPYEIRDIVDRIGGGDSFSAGLVYALNSGSHSSPADALAFAVAASCLKHSVKGDYNLCSLDEVLSLLGGNASGRVAR